MELFTNIDSLLNASGTQTGNLNTLLTVSRDAMNGEFEVAFPRGRYPQGTEAALDALDEVERLEQVLSVFRFDSRIQYINLTAHDAPVPLDDELFGLLENCLRLAAETDGAVDITSGPLWKVWGFARRNGRVPSEEEIQTALEKVDYRSVELDPVAKTVRFLKPGVELNFGCVGKGFALDVAAEKLKAKDVDRFLFHGGLSSVLAVGSAWTVGVAHPMRLGKRLAEISLTDEAIGTSGSQQQFFRYRGRRFSHLIDPRTGWPAEGVLSVTVVAPTGTLSELLSTAFFVMGPDKIDEYCRRHPELVAVCVLPSTKRSGFDVFSYGNAEERVRFVDNW